MEQSYFAAASETIGTEVFIKPYAIFLRSIVISTKESNEPV